MALRVRVVGILGCLLVPLACSDGGEAPPGTGAAPPGGTRPMGGGAPGPQGGSLPASVAPGPLQGAAALGPLAPWARPGRLQRLTRVQYFHTVKDLLGVEPRDVELGGDDAAGPSGFDEAGVMGPEELRGFQQAAEALAAAVDPSAPGVLPCSPATPAEEDGCASQFVGTFGRRLFRRPVGAPEAAELLTLYRTARSELGLGFPDAIRTLLTAMLQSPRFLYRWDTMGNLDQTTRPTPLDGWARASRLSYFLWSSVPDPELLAAAESGGLAGEAGVEQQARRMLTDPRAGRMVESFHRQWLDLGPVDVRGDDLAIHDSLLKPTNLVPFLEQRPLFAAMARETTRFAVESMLGSQSSPSPTLTALLLGSSWLLEPPLATIYQAAPIAGTDPERRQVPQRAGILTQASFLARHASGGDSHPVLRGRVIFEKVICGSVPEPPPEIPSLKPAMPGITTRDRYADHGTNACAIGCHALIDPLGFGLERFDGIGRFRSEERGKMVDTSGRARLPIAGELPFASTEEMLAKLADSEDVRRCFVRQLSRLALGRLERDEDSPSLEAAFRKFAAAGFDIRELVVALTTTPAFLTLSPGRTLP